MSSSAHSASKEIESRLRKRFLDRLSMRMLRMRRGLAERDWPVLRAECKSISGSGRTFGFEQLSSLASEAEHLIPRGEISKAQPIPQARKALEHLIFVIDALLEENQITPRS